MKHVWRLFIGFSWLAAFGFAALVLMLLCLGANYAYAHHKIAVGCLWYFSLVAAFSYYFGWCVEDK